MPSIVIVNWNSGQLLERCVNSLQRHAGGCEIVLVDNASRDSSLDFVGRLESPPLLIRNAHNAGFAAASNQGWRAGHGETVLFLNPDTESLPCAVETLARRIGDDPGVWAAGGRLLHPSGTPDPRRSARAFPSIPAVAAEMLLLDEIWPRNPWTRRYRMTDWDHATARDVDQPAGACLMVRRSALDSLGGFDESFWPAWFEDVDLCRRIRGAGGRIVFEPRAAFLHHGGVSLRNLDPEDFLRFYYLNLIRYFRKHHGSRGEARVRRLVRTGMILRALLAVSGASFSDRAGAASPRAFLRVARLVTRSSGAGT